MSDYVLHLASFKHKRENAYSCMVVGGQVEQWQLDLLQKFIDENRIKPEEKTNASEFI